VPRERFGPGGVAELHRYDERSVELRRVREGVPLAGRHRADLRRLDMWLPVRQPYARSLRRDVREHERRRQQLRRLRIPVRDW